MGIVRDRWVSGEERNGEVVGYEKDENHSNTIVLLVRADAIGSAVGDYHEGFYTSADGIGAGDV